MKISKLKKLLALAVVTLVASSAFFPSGASAAWKQDSAGWWNTEGDSYSIGWRAINNTWYYFDANGYMKTGWVKDGSSWYYLEPSGTMKTGWELANGSWYYLNDSGVMKTGLVDVNGKTYYLNDSGAMQTGTVTVNGVNYTFSTTGEKSASDFKYNTTTITDTTSTPTNEIAGSGGSGGAGGGGGAAASTTSNVQTSSNYKDLYGTWTIAKRIPSTMKSSFSDTMLSLAEGEPVKVDSNKLESSMLTVTNPTISEGTMTASEFSQKYNDTLKNIGISDDSVKYVTVTQTDNQSRTATILIANDRKTYAIARGAVFEITKK